MNEKYTIQITPVHKVPNGIRFSSVYFAQGALRMLEQNERSFRRSKRKEALEILQLNLNANPLDGAKEIVKEHAEMGYNERHKKGKRFNQLKPKDQESRCKMSYPLITHLIYDEYIENYEERIHKARSSKSDLVNRIKNIIKPFNGYIIDSGDRVEIFIMDAELDNDVKIAEMVLDDRRFAVLNRLAVAPIYKHGGSGRHYVKDCYGVFIRRFLVRNLSQYDNPTNGLRSRDGFFPNDEDKKVAVVRHLRAAQQGKSYFISCTSTRDPIFGSTGANFLTAQNGQVIIDAAQIDTNKLVDVHSLRAVENIIGVSSLDFHMKFTPNDQTYEKNAAARDTVRTREVLIEGAVPRDAIVAIRKGGESWKTLSGNLLSSEDAELFECPFY